jgi:hypothetical protein
LSTESLRSINCDRHTANETNQNNRVEVFSQLFLEQFRSQKKRPQGFEIKSRTHNNMSSKDPETLRTEVTLEKKALVAEITSSDGDDENVDCKVVSVWHDAQDTVGLAVPMFLSMLSWVGMKTTDSALLGHLSADALAAAALSDLVRANLGGSINACMVPFIVVFDTLNIGLFLLPL